VQAVDRLETIGGRSRVPSFDHHTPLTAVVFFDDDAGIERRIDFLVAPLGLDSRDVRDTAVEIEIGAGAPRRRRGRCIRSASWRAGSPTSRFSASTTPRDGPVADVDS
jgi:hypothetical protein